MVVFFAVNTTQKKGFMCKEMLKFHLRFVIKHQLLGGYGPQAPYRGFPLTLLGTFVP